MIKAVIFDLDGVLVNSHPVHKRAWARFLESMGKPASDDVLEFVLDGRKREDILAHFLGTLTPEQVVEYGRRKESLFREEASHVTEVAGVESFLDELRRRRIPLAVASCGSSSRVHFILQRLALQDRFAAVVTADDVSSGKPDPEIFHRAAAKICTSPEAVLVVEDAVAGVVAAKAAGMKCLGIESNGRGRALRAAGADEVIPDFRNLDVSALLTRFD